MKSAKEIFLTVYTMTAVWVYPGITPYSIASQLALLPTDIISGITMEIDGTAAPPRLRVKVCGPDVTQLPASGFPLRFGFDTTVRQVTGDYGHTSLTIGTQVTGQAVTVALTRDPFTPPAPWYVTLHIDLARVPGTGSLTLGTLPVQDMPAGFATTGGNTMIIYGHGCDDLRAALPSHEGSGWRG